MTVMGQSRSSGVYHDCYWNSYPTTIWWTSLSTWDPDVATFASGTENLYGEGDGYTYGSGEFDVTEWWTDNMDCYQYYWHTADNAPVEVTCTFPQGETTTSAGWSILDPTKHKWNQTLTGGLSFTGRTITEQAGTSSDTCHFPNSAFAPATLSGGTWTVVNSDQWGSDFVGWFPNAVTYYRQQGRAPCGANIEQRMFIDCPRGPIHYITNTIGGDITATTVTSRRAGQSVSRTWP